MKVAAVIPAYNEEKTIADVVKVVRDCALIDEVVVVDDGSQDNTALLAKKARAVVVSLPANIGKGGAMFKGVEYTSAPVILFLDADLVGLRNSHIEKLLNPVLREGYSMSIGVFNKGRLATDLALKIAPFLSGQRVLKRELLKDIDNIDITRFGVEMVLTDYVQKENLSVKEVVLEDLTHRLKEEKMGFFSGFLARLGMYWDILKFFTRTKVKH